MVIYGNLQPWIQVLKLDFSLANEQCLTRMQGNGRRANRPLHFHEESLLPVPSSLQLPSTTPNYHRGLLKTSQSCVEIKYTPRQILQLLLALGSSQIILQKDLTRYLHNQGLQSRLWKTPNQANPNCYAPGSNLLSRVSSLSFPQSKSRGHKACLAKFNNGFTLFLACKIWIQKCTRMPTQDLWDWKASETKIRDPTECTLCHSI